MQTQSPQAFSARLEPGATGEASLFTWLNMLRSDLASRGVAAGGAFSQFSSDSVLVGYRLDLTAAEKMYLLECRLQEEGGTTALRLEFTDQASKRIVLSYRLHLGANAAQESLQELATRIARAKERVRLVGQYFQQACEKGTLH